MTMKSMSDLLFVDHIRERPAGLVDGLEEGGVQHEQDARTVRLHGRVLRLVRERRHLAEPVVAPVRRDDLRGAVLVG